MELSLVHTSPTPLRLKIFNKQRLCLLTATPSNFSLRVLDLRTMKQEREVVSHEPILDFQLVKSQLVVLKKSGSQFLLTYQDSKDCHYVPVRNRLDCFDPMLISMHGPLLGVYQRRDPLQLLQVFQYQPWADEDERVLCLAELWVQKYAGLISRSRKLYLFGGWGQEFQIKQYRKDHRFRTIRTIHMHYAFALYRMKGLFCEFYNFKKDLFQARQFLDLFDDIQYALHQTKDKLQGNVKIDDLVYFWDGKGTVFQLNRVNRELKQALTCSGKVGLYLGRECVGRNLVHAAIVERKEGSVKVTVKALT